MDETELSNDHKIDSETLCAREQPSALLCLGFVGRPVEETQHVSRCAISASDATSPSSRSPAVLNFTCVLLQLTRPHQLEELCDVRARSASDLTLFQLGHAQAKILPVET